jgi:hypothetical protein
MGFLLDRRRSASDHPDPDRCAAATCQEQAPGRTATRQAAAASESAQESGWVRTDPGRPAEGPPAGSPDRSRTSPGDVAAARPREADRAGRTSTAGSARAGGRSPRPAAHPCPGCTAAADTRRSQQPDGDQQQEHGGDQPTTEIRTTGGRRWVCAGVTGEAGLHRVRPVLTGPAATVRHYGLQPGLCGPGTPSSRSSRSFEPPGPCTSNRSSASSARRVQHRRPLVQDVIATIEVGAGGDGVVRFVRELTIATSTPPSATIAAVMTPPTMMMSWSDTPPAACLLLAPRATNGHRFPRAISRLRRRRGRTGRATRRPRSHCPGRRRRPRTKRGPPHPAQRQDGEPRQASCTSAVCRAQQDNRHHAGQEPPAHTYRFAIAYTGAVPAL